MGLPSEIVLLGADSWYRRGQAYVLGRPLPELILFQEHGNAFTCVNSHLVKWPAGLPILANRLEILF